LYPAPSAVAAVRARQEQHGRTGSCIGEIEFQNNSPYSPSENGDICQHLTVNAKC
jgi:hypothetical protein